MNVLIYEHETTSLLWRGDLQHLPVIGDTIFFGGPYIVTNRVFNVTMGFVNIYVK